MDEFANSYENDEFAVVTLSPNSAHFSGTENSTPISESQSSTNVFIMPSPAGETSPLKETTTDPFLLPRFLRNVDGLCIMITSMIVFSISITIALVIQIYTGQPQITPRGGVVSSDPYCTKLGLNLLQVDAGSSADAAVLTALCLAVTNPHAVSIGGGGFALVHQQKLLKKATKSYNFREMSPSYFSNSSNVASTFSGKTMQEVPLQMSIATPGMLIGLERLHKAHGKLLWSDILGRIAALARKGTPVSAALSNAILQLNLTNIPTPLRTLVTKSDNTTKLKEGDILVQPLLANTLQVIGIEGANAFYKGSLTAEFLREMSSLGSVLAPGDLNSYAANISYGLHEAKYGEKLVVTGEFPSSGYALHSTIDTMLGYPSVNQNSPQNDNFLQVHRLTEALKYGYAELSKSTNSTHLKQGNITLSIGAYIRSKINDTQSYPLAHYMDGTQPVVTRNVQQHVCVIGPDNYIITISMSLGSSFGSKLMSLGFLLNDAMLDFSWPGKTQSPLEVPQRNLVRGNAQPLSPLVPTLIIPSSSKCGDYMIPAAGPQLMAVAGVAEVLVAEASGQPITNSLAASRFNQMLDPYVLQLEGSQPASLVQYLQERGHNVAVLPQNKTLGIVNALMWVNDKIRFYKDPRDSSQNPGLTF
uniref:Glutathione hydrolase n=2 Tax=Ciona savignyi TaxID=51511 RepID=H2Z1W5_CIOSA